MSQQTTVTPSAVKPADATPKFSVKTFHLYSALVIKFDPGFNKKVISELSKHRPVQISTSENLDVALVQDASRLAQSPDPEIDETKKLLLKEVDKYIKRFCSVPGLFMQLLDTTNEKNKYVRHFWLIFGLRWAANTGAYLEANEVQLHVRQFGTYPYAVSWVDVPAWGVPNLASIYGESSFIQWARKSTGSEEGFGKFAEAIRMNGDDECDGEGDEEGHLMFRPPSRSSHPWALVQAL